MTSSATTIAVECVDSPDSEVSAKARRRTLTTAYNLAILDELDRAKQGEAVTILRREGLYSSSLVEWRRQRKQGLLRAQAPVRRGPRRRSHRRIPGFRA